MRRERTQPAIDALVAKSFGPGRFALTAYRLREGNPFLAPLSFVAREGGEIIGSVRFVSVEIGDAKALLLGPLVVDPQKRGGGAGRALVARGCEEALPLGHQWVFLVGDLPYYEKVGFRRVPSGQILMPGPIDLRRLLVRPLGGCGVTPSGVSSQGRFEETPFRVTPARGGYFPLPNFSSIILYKAVLWLS